MTTLLTAAAIIAAAAIATSLGESCSDRFAGGILPGAAILAIGLIIGGLICH